MINTIRKLTHVNLIIIYSLLNTTNIIFGMEEKPFSSKTQLFVQCSPSSDKCILIDGKNNNKIRTLPIEQFKQAYVSWQENSILLADLFDTKVFDGGYLNSRKLYAGKTIYNISKTNHIYNKILDCQDAQNNLKINYMTSSASLFSQYFNSITPEECFNEKSPINISAKASKDSLVTISRNTSVSDKYLFHCNGTFSELTFVLKANNNRYISFKFLPERIFNSQSQEVGLNKESWISSIDKEEKKKNYDLIAKNQNRSEL